MWEPLLEFSSLFNECGSRLAAVGQQGSPRQAAASRCDRRGGPPKLTGLGSRATGDKHRDTPTRQSFDGLADPTIGWSACTFACLSGVVRTAIIVMPDRTDLRFDQRPSGPYPVPPNRIAEKPPGPLRRLLIQATPLPSPSPVMKTWSPNPARSRSKRDQLKDQNDLADRSRGRRSA